MIKNCTIKPCVMRDRKKSVKTESVSFFLHYMNLNIPKDTALQKLKEKYPLSENEAENYLAEYWSE